MSTTLCPQCPGKTSSKFNIGSPKAGAREKLKFGLKLVSRCCIDEVEVCIQNPGGRFGDAVWLAASVTRALFLAVACSKQACHCCQLLVFFRFPLKSYGWALTTLQKSHKKVSE